MLSVMGVSIRHTKNGKKKILRKKQVEKKVQVKNDEQ